MKAASTADAFTLSEPHARKPPGRATGTRRTSGVPLLAMTTCAADGLLDQPGELVLRFEHVHLHGDSTIGDYYGLARLADIRARECGYHGGMAPRVLGLHHVTATVDEAQADLDLCVGTLGLRLVKTTVNFDNHHVYHFYYGDERGTPGTIWTTFPYKGHGVAVGEKGAGQVVTTSFSVPHGSLAFWRARLAHAGVAATDVEERFGETGIAFADESGLEFELLASAHDGRRGRVVDDIDATAAIRGLHSVTLVVRDAEPTLDFMASLGWRVVARDGHRIRTAVQHGGPGHTIDVVADSARPQAVNGLGTVHHVAMGIGSADEQAALRDDLLTRGVRVTDIRDRCYFTSVYFREPGGVLFEVATVTPGFAVDEPLDSLGTGLKLPHWEEAKRAEIERGLPRIFVPTTRRAERPGD